MKTFWEFKGHANKKGELFLYGEISDASWWGDEVTPAQFQKDLAALGQIEQLDVYINSPGGDVFAGITIYNILKRHSAKVTVHVDGLAASAASVVAMAGDRIVMPKNATLMIHNAWSIGWGNKTAMRSLADELERLDGQLADIYAARTGKDAGVVALWMDAERWMSGDEALKDGFCDEVEENKQIAACADAEKFFAQYKHPPQGLAPPENEPEQEPEAAENGGFSLPENGGKEPDNGAVQQPQPAADKNPEAKTDTLADQRKWFNDLRKKIIGGITHHGENS
jgi:ATP-dependent Clp protease protease subunit